MALKMSAFLTLCMCCSARSGAEGGLQLLESSLSLLLLHFLPLAFLFFLPNLSFKLAALRHRLHLETYNPGGKPVRQTQITSNNPQSKCKKNAHFQLLRETSRSWKGEKMQQNVSLWGRRCAIYPVLACCGITSVYHSGGGY